MKYCPICTTDYTQEQERCPHDGARLVDKDEWAPGLVVRNKYRVVARIGRGGMGIVYKAEHLIFKDLWALKVMNPRLSEDPEFIRRFYMEAEKQRRLKHRNVVRVEDVDQADDAKLFIGMEFVDGMSLREMLYAAQAPLAPGLALNIVRGVADALEAADALGIVHRDIKPDNILLARETGGGFIPKLTDFGVAKLREGTAPMSKAPMLTPQYAAPEQWQPDPDQPPDGRTDLYALGMTAFEMLTGRMPFAASSDQEWMYAHLNDAPPAPSTVNPELDPRWDDIVLGLLQKDRAYRTPSAADLLVELRGLEAPVTGPMPTFAATVPQPRRLSSKPQPAAAAAAAATRPSTPRLSTPAPPAPRRPSTPPPHIPTPPQRTVTPAQRTPTPSRVPAPRVPTPAQRISSRSGAELPPRSVPARYRDAEPVVAEAAAEDAQAPKGSGVAIAIMSVFLVAAVGAGWYFRADLMTQWQTIRGNGTPAAGSSQSPPEAAPSQPPVQQPATQTAVPPAPAPANPTPAETQPAATPEPVPAQPTAPPESARQALTGHADAVLSVAFDPQGHWLVSGSQDQTLKIWDYARGRLSRDVSLYMGFTAAVAFRPNGREMAAATWSHSVAIVTLANGKVLHTLQGHTGPVEAVAYSHNGRLLASGSDDHTVRLWDGATGQPGQVLQAPAGVDAVAFGPNGELASGGDDSAITLWNTGIGKAEQTLSEDTASIRALAFGPRGRWLASGSDDHSVRVWNLSTGQSRALSPGHGDIVTAVAFSPDGRWLASGGGDDTVKIWNTSDWSLVATLHIGGGGVRGLAFSPNSHWLAAAGGDHSIALWQSKP